MQQVQHCGRRQAITFSYLMILVMKFLGYSRSPTMGMRTRRTRTLGYSDSRLSTMACITRFYLQQAPCKTGYRTNSLPCHFAFHTGTRPLPSVTTHHSRSHARQASSNAPLRSI